MADYDKLRGFSGQSMGGPKVSVYEVPSYTTPGSYTFTAPQTGLYKFVLWGAGGSQGGTQTAGCGSAGYCEYARPMGAGETASVVVGLAAGGGGNNGTASTVTFRDGKVVSAGGGAQGTGGVGGTGGTATGGDVNINGSAGGASGGAGAAGGGTSGGAAGTSGGGGSGGGAGAPANSPYQGAPGGTISGASNSKGLGPGAGACGVATGDACGGNGLVLVQCRRPVF